MELLRSYTTEVLAVRREFQTVSPELRFQKPSVECLKMKVQLLTDATETAADLRKALSAKDAGSASTKSELDTKEAVLKVKVREYHQLNYDLGVGLVCCRSREQDHPSVCPETV